MESLFHATHSARTRLHNHMVRHGCQIIPPVHCYNLLAGEKRSSRFYSQFRVSQGIKCTAAKSSYVSRDIQEEMMGAVLVAGAGLAGLCLAASLEKTGIPYFVLEQRGELSQEGAAIALWRNALTALDAIGVADAIRAEYAPMHTVRLCRDDGTILKEFSFDECSENPELIGIPRSRLQQLLLDAVDSRRVLFNAPVASVNTADTGVILEDGTELRARLVVGADGLRSSVAQGLNVPPANFCFQAGYRGLATFDGPAPVSGGAVCQIWSADGVRAGLYPVTESLVYWFVTFDCDGELPAQSSDKRKAAAAALVRGWDHGIEQCVAGSPADKISRSRFFDKWPLPLPVLQSGSFTLCGDALHPMTPNLGQGGCTALEDGIVLTRMLCDVWGSGNRSELEGTLREFERQRSIRCLKLAVRSNLIGRALQSSNPIIVAARDLTVRTAIDPANFFNHALYDCGGLPARF